MDQREFIRQVQQMIGTEADGYYGANTGNAWVQWKEKHPELWAKGNVGPAGKKGTPGPPGITKTGEDFWSHLILREGFRAQVYTDSLGKRTIGIGTLMPLTQYECEMCGISPDLADSDELAVTKNQAKKIANLRLKKNWSDLMRLREDIIVTLPHDVQDALKHVVFQLGPGGLDKFPSMWRALKEGDYAEAIVQARDSAWYQQTPVRTDDLTDVFARHT